MVGAIVLGIYLAGIVITGMVCAFRNGADLACHDEPEAVWLAFLWPILAVVGLIVSPFMLAHAAGRLWREWTTARAADAPTPSPEAKTS